LETNNPGKQEGIFARKIACEILVQIVKEGRSLAQIEEKHISQIPPGRDRSLARELVYGVLRQFFFLEGIANQLLQKPFKGKDTDVRMVVFLGLYQLEFMRVPEYASISATVELTRLFKKAWATKLVNAVLRGFQRGKEELIEKLDESARCAHPEWLLSVIKKDWPKNWQAIAEANNQQAPMCLRANLTHATRDDYMRTLAQADIQSEACKVNRSGIILHHAVDVVNLPGFAQGTCTVQDLAPQFSAELLLIEDGNRVLDACAAPGGKTTHVLESFGERIALVALEKDEHRVQRLKENLARFEGAEKVTVHVADAASTDSWWDGQLFDRILLDAPCTGTGVIRRNPDIKLLRRPKDIRNLTQQQSRLLNELWALLKPGGYLLYATCSILADENSRQIKTFLASHEDASYDDLDVKWGHNTGYGVQILTGEQQMDGFFYARIRKLELK